MTSFKQQFGYLPRNLEISTDHVEIRSLDTLEQSIRLIDNSPQVLKDWFYCALETEINFSTRKALKIPTPKRIFALPKTHVIEVKSATEIDAKRKLEFYVWCLSFLLGIRLTTTQAGFVDATPIKEGKLVDLIVTVQNLVVAFEAIERFWQQHGSTDIGTTIGAAIHSLFMSQYPKNLQYEEFAYLYMSLDACFAITKLSHKLSERVPQWKLTSWLCETYRLECPEWGMVNTTDTKKSSTISEIRNDLFHQALWNSQPMGFSIKANTITPSLNLQFKALVCRLLVAILGIEAPDYIASSCKTRMNYRLE
jgi:hypothetical protein